MTTHHTTRHTADDTADAAPDTGAQGAVELGGFRALNPADGLFLRAEHLSTMQSYARDLVAATATAAGTGVVHGLGVSLSADGHSIEVSPGLAVSPGGRLLRLVRTLTAPLDDAHLGDARDDAFWVVTLHWAAGTSGSATVYGSLCNDACSDNGSHLQPWVDEGVAVRLVPDALPGLDATLDDERRNWLASAYFERERAAGPPWLTPVARHGRVAPLGDRPWDDGTALRADGGVPLAVLLPRDDGWCVDMWTARRLVDGALAHATWRSRLAMRPWTVFLAQVLQLEDELADAESGFGEPGKVVVVDVDVDDPAREPVERFKEQMEKTFVARWHQFRDFDEATRDAPRPVGRARVVRSLRGHGLLELPPAGYLPVDERQDGLEKVMVGYFGGQVDVRLRRMRADQVADEVEAAQHRDRIPLVPETDQTAAVDVLVPLHPADKAALSTPAYGWVAFVRRPPVCPDAADPVPERPREQVGVFVVVEPERGWQYEGELDEGQFKDAEHLGDLDYPADGWDYPGGDLATRVLRLARKRQLDIVGIVAFTLDDARHPLGALRGTLFGASLDTGLRLPVHAHTTQTGREALVVVLEQPVD